MEPDFSKLFHQQSKTFVGANIPENINEWPEEWLTTYYKTYPRLPKIMLPETPVNGDFFELIKKRESRRNFNKEPLSIGEISTLLKYSCGNTRMLAEDGEERHHRAQPSAGARFPIEMYLLVFKETKDIPQGVFHYNVSEHALDVLWKRTFTLEDIANLIPAVRKWKTVPVASFMMTSVFGRNQDKYGVRGYRHILLEAGHIGQNIYLIAETLKLKCCALSGTDDKKIEDLLRIDGINESLVYTYVAGK